MSAIYTVASKQPVHCHVPSLRKLTNNRLLDHFHSYYGGLICVCWSPDGKYVLTGGQDDLISIWHVPDAVLIARCQGHHSWVTSVAFDPWRCDDKNYRFGSVGEDRRLCLWDFSVGMLHRPRAGGAGGGVGGAAGGGRHGSITRGSTLGRAESAGSGLAGSAVNGGGDERAAAGGREADAAGNGGRFTGPKPVEPRASTAMLPPVLTKVVDAGPLAWLEFTEEAIMTSSKSGMFRCFPTFRCCFIPNNSILQSLGRKRLANPHPQRPHPDMEPPIRIGHHGSGRRDLGELSFGGLQSCGI